MTLQQQGTYRHGTYGFPVDITLSAPPYAPINLATVATIQLVLNRPPDAALLAVTVNLAVPGAVIDATNGIIEWVVQSGDLPVAGIYRFVITLGFPGPSELTIDGSMKVI